MKKGWLIVNHFLNGKKYTEIYNFLKDAAEKKGVSLTLKTGAELMHEMTENIKDLPDFALFWDKDIRLAKALEKRGLRLFNPASAVELCEDKSLTHLALLGKVKMPKTIVAPMTFPAVGYSDLSFVKQAGEMLGFPMIIKECFGSFGGQVYLVKTLEEAEEKVQSLAGVPFIFQAYIAASHGRDVRLQVVGETVVAAMERHSVNGDFRANISAGGTMQSYVPNEALSSLAVFICRELGLDFAGVDFLFDEKGEPVLCEVNSNAHFKNLYDCTGVNVADSIIEHILRSL